MHGSVSFSLLSTAGLAVALLATKAHSMSPGRDGHGLIGYGIDMYDPVCASACQAAAPMTLFCSDAASFEDDGMGGMSMMVMPDETPSVSDGNGANSTSTPSPTCMANNLPWLQTVAYCISTHCPDAVSTMQREQYWYTNLIGRMDNQPVPVMSYSQALMSLSPSQPNTTGSTTEPLRSAVLVDQATFTSNANSYANFQHAEALHSRYSLVIFLTCVALPIALSLLRFIPRLHCSRLYAIIQAHVIDAPLFTPNTKTQRITATGTGSTTTRAQALFLAYIVILNVILSAVGFRSASPSAWYESTSDEILAFVANRTGVLSFVNVPLLILYAGRNNVLLYVTDWSRATFVKLHRCVSVVCTLQACIHSALYLRIELKKGQSAYDEESREAYWIWGIVGTLALSLLLPFSLAQLRKRAYEIFLVLHVGLAVLAIVGCWYHIIKRFGHQWGYELWLYVAMAVWAFDRLTRVGRIIVAGGLHHATLYAIDDDYIRVDIEGLRGGRAGGHLYAYFFSLPSQWPWQNHPFSVVPFTGVATNKMQSLGIEESNNDASIASRDEKPESDEEKHEITPCDAAGVCSPRATAATNAITAASMPILARGRNKNSITLLVRVRNGTTRALQKYMESLYGSDEAPRVPCWIEPGYGVSNTAGGLDGVCCDVRQHCTQYPNVVCIAGGVGITALLPLLAQADASVGTTKLFWGARSAALVQTVEQLMAEQNEQASWPAENSRLTVSYAVGERMDIHGVLAAELNAEHGTQVIVSGPPSMMHDVRAAVVQLMKTRNVKVRLVEESFVF